MSKFKTPDFKERPLEVRLNGDEVCIYGTKTGLKRLAELCLKLVNGAKSDSSEHIHLEDFEILTPESKRCVVAVFDGDSAEGEAKFGDKS
jgi:hypothetical protein